MMQTAGDDVLDRIKLLYDPMFAIVGVAALLGMLNSCSPNVCVVNIDNGFGAAYVAAMMVRR